MQLLKAVLLYGLLMVTAQAPAMAASCLFAADSTIRPNRPHSLKEQAFLERYGTDDTSQALITYYFQKRKTQKSVMLGSGIITVIAGGAAGLVLLAAAGFNLVNFLLIVSLLATAYFTGTVLVITSLFFIINNRRRLYRWVNDYHNGKGLPHRIRRKKSFLRLLKQD